MLDVWAFSLDCDHRGAEWSTLTATRPSASFRAQPHLSVAAAVYELMILPRGESHRSWSLSPPQVDSSPSWFPPGSCSSLLVTSPPAACRKLATVAFAPVSVVERGSMWMSLSKPVQW